jgi:hypothetical protein
MFKLLSAVCRERLESEYRQITQADGKEPSRFKVQSKL